MDKCLVREGGVGGLEVKKKGGAGREMRFFLVGVFVEFESAL